MRLPHVGSLASTRRGHHTGASSSRTEPRHCYALLSDSLQRELTRRRTTNMTFNISQAAVCYVPSIHETSTNAKRACCSAESRVHVHTIIIAKYRTREVHGARAWRRAAGSERLRCRAHPGRTIAQGQLGVTSLSGVATRSAFPKRHIAHATSTCCCHAQDTRGGQVTQAAHSSTHLLHGRERSSIPSLRCVADVARRLASHTGKHMSAPSQHKVVKVVPNRQK